MPPKASSWDKPELLVDLCIGLYQAADAAHALTPAVKDAIGAYLNERGHDTSWNAIRQHVQKLRKNRDTNGITTAAGGATPTTPSKPSPAKTPKTSARKRAAAESSKLKLEYAKEEDDDDLYNKLIVKEEAMSGVEDTPTKPAKRARNKSTTPAATADDDAEV